MVTISENSLKRTFDPPIIPFRMTKFGTIVFVSLIGLALIIFVVIERRNLTNDVDDASLLESIRWGDLDSIREYLARGGSVDRSIDVYGRSMPLLRVAVTDREEEIALALLDAGADIEASDVTTQQVARSGLNRILERILDASEAGQENVGYFGVLDAALNGYYDTVEIFVARAEGRGDASATEFGEGAGAAMLAGYDDVARLLLQNTDDIDEMLHVAARFSSPGLIRYLVSRGLDANGVLDLPDDDYATERTPIAFAWKRYVEENLYFDSVPVESHQWKFRNEDATHVMYELLSVGAVATNDEIVDAARNGAAGLEGARDGGRLEEAARFGYYDIVEQMLSTNDGLTADDLRSAVIVSLMTDHDDIARLLLGSGAPVDGGPLHIASAASSPGMVRYILALGADPAERYEDMLPVEYWLEESVTEDPELILHELITGGAEVCWLTDVSADLPGLSADILMHSAPDCWTD